MLQAQGAGVTSLASRFYCSKNCPVYQLKYKKTGLIPSSCTEIMCRTGALRHPARRSCAGQAFRAHSCAVCQRLLPLTGTVPSRFARNDLWVRRGSKTRQNPTKADSFAYFADSFLRNESIFFWSKGLKYQKYAQLKQRARCRALIESESIRALALYRPAITLAFRMTTTQHSAETPIVRG
jgi:hypothetical protein